MKLFYGEIEGNVVTINDEEQQHIVKVLRMKNGEAIHVTDGKGNLASGKLMIEGKKAHIEG
jgi:16S rRNA (uracil1498-N3)-methyltransferase